MKTGAIKVGIGVLICGLLQLAAAQSNPLSDYMKKGKVVASGRISSSGGELEVVGYRLETIDLDKPLTRTGVEEVTAAFRVVFITRDTLQTDDFSIWIDDLPHQAIQLKPNELALLIYARTLPNKRLQFAISKRNKTEMNERSILNSKLQVPFEYATSLQELEANDPVILLRRLPPLNRVIELSVEIPDLPCEPGSKPIFIAIDGQVEPTTCYGTAYVNRFTIERFARLRDGAELKLTHGSRRDARTLKLLGPLVKRSVQ